MRFPKQRLRQFWFQVHKWIGLTLALLIIPISLTGSALVWHDWLDEALNPERRVSALVSLPPSAYATAARRNAGPGEQLLSLAYPEAGGAIAATLARPASGGGRPVRTLFHLHPTTGAVLDRSASNEGLVHVMHVLHGSLMVPGVGRQIVGWIGVAMLLSSLTGLWLWWPLKGGFRRGLGWRRQPTTSANLHHQGGFWIALPLTVLSLTGAWISFPAFFGPLAGDPVGPSPTERMRRMAAPPLAATRMTPEQVLAAAEPHAPGPIAQVSWPTAPTGEWKLSYRRAGGSAEVTVLDATGTAKPPRSRSTETTARLMRRIHDGTGMGRLWQIVISVGGIIPAALAVTGIIMWLNVRKRRRSMGQRRGRLQPAPAE